jgi:hypothetical protein
VQVVSTKKLRNCSYFEKEPSNGEFAGLKQAEPIGFSGFFDEKTSAAALYLYPLEPGINLNCRIITHTIATRF